LKLFIIYYLSILDIVFLNIRQIKRLFERIQADWNLLQDEHEREIIASYAEYGRLITIFLTSKIFLSIATFIYLHIKHACGLLKIASYRMERVMDMENMQQISPLEREHIMCVRIMRAVNIQQKAMKFEYNVYISYFIVLLILSLNVFGLFQFLPNFLDIIAPLNESRERYLSFSAEYFIDQKQYFYLILTHGLLAVYIGSAGVLATGSSLIGFISHICAMLKIASYRLEHLSDNLSSVSELEKDCIIRKRIINVVDIHRRAIELVFDLQKKS
ncbi:uncharacterized protein LOC105426952, partial [Pogonomyrmex barbatus]|uniref:Uncharacterized protein LOC105426952 n=1 Tax=Pogonomyrmex barbatus TaxID=144034 RepID=A0A8N1S5C0_9HYME